MTTAEATTRCARCGAPLQWGALRCASCGELVYRQTLEQLSAQALAREPSDPLGAAAIWQHCLTMVPPDAPQYQQLRDRVAMLVARQPQYADGHPAPPPPPPARGDDPLHVALVKTLGSMVISIVIYAAMFHGADRWPFATGFVLLILVHELGHVVAMRWYGLSASPPIFIPFVGALINLRQSPRDAREEAIVGIAGPVAGTIASAACLVWWMAHPHQTLFLDLANFGFLINLFNMLPVPPLDGGRVTAAVSPWIWMPGLLVVAAWIAYDLMSGNGVPWLLVVLLFYAWPRVKATLAGRQRHLPYYQIGRLASVTIGAAYLVLGLALVALFFLTSRASLG